MSRELTPEERARYKAMLKTSEGRETVAANLKKMIRQRADENGTTVTAFVVDHLLPGVVDDRDGTIFLLTVLADIAVEDHVRQRSPGVH